MALNYIKDPIKHKDQQDLRKLDETIEHLRIVSLGKKKGKSFLVGVQTDLEDKGKLLCIKNLDTILSKVTRV